MYRWPDEVVKTLAENVSGKTAKQLTELMNSQGFDVKYNMVFTDERIKYAKSRYGFKSGTKGGHPKGYSPKYPPGMEEYIRSIAADRNTDEIARMVSEHFGIHFSSRQCKAYKKNHKIISGLTGRFEPGHVPANKGQKGIVYLGSEKGWFRKGHVPKNHRPVGSERISRDGYIEVKTGEPRKWELKHRIVWKRHNGEIPKGHVVIFRDGDKANTAIENLMLIKRSTHAIMNHTDLHEYTGDLKETAVRIAELKHETKKAQRRTK